MKKTIIVTGGSGFVGANVIRRLIKDNINTHVIIRKHNSIWRLKDIRNKIHIHEGILEDSNKLKNLFKKLNPFAIYHLSTYGSYPSQQDQQLMVKTNILGTMNLLNALVDIPYKNLIAAGSSSEYGKKAAPMRESDLLEPNNLYASMKASQTHLCQVYAKTHHKPITILRLFSVYGFFEEPGRLVRSVIDCALNNQNIKLATGREARDFIYAEDVADAFLHASNTKPFFGEVFNVGTGIQTSIKQLAQQVTSLSKSKSTIQLGAYPGRTWDSSHWVADMHKTNKILGWRAKTSLKEGLKLTIDWFKKNGQTG